MITFVGLMIALGLLLSTSMGVSKPVISKNLINALELRQWNTIPSDSSGLIIQDQSTSDFQMAKASGLLDERSTSTVLKMEPSSSDGPYAILLGDSITDRSTSPEGFTTQLTQKYGNTISILNRGVGGISTRGVLPIARDLFVLEDTSFSQIRFITLLLGTNDSVDWGDSRVPLGEYVQNLSMILDMISPSVIKLLITPPIPSEPTWNGRTEAQTALYAKACRNLGRELEAVGEGVILVDFWQAMEEYRQEEGHALEDLLVDGVHLNENGNRLLSRLVLETLETRL